MPYTIEATLSTKERNRLDDAQFGLPDERKYPLIDKKHVQSAISYFFKCPEKDRHELAINIQKAAKKFGVEIGPDTEVAKYLNESTEEAWNEYALEMVTMIEYSNRFVVMEQTKADGFFQSIWKMIKSGLYAIGRAISSMASWIWEKIQSIFRRITKKGPEFVEVPKIFKNLKTALPLAESVAIDVTAACVMLMRDLKDIAVNVNDKDFIRSFGAKTESWRMTKLAFVKNSGLCYQQTNLSIGDSAVQQTTWVKRSEVDRMLNDANKIVKNLNGVSREVINGSKMIDETGALVKRNYSFFQIDVRKAFESYAISGKNLISDGLSALHLTSESIRKVILLTGTAVTKQETEKEESEPSPTPENQE